MQDADHLREVANDCVHCGFCLPACPTYQLWAEEMDSPRGRIYLVNQILDGAELTPAAAEHFDRGLVCPLPLRETAGGAIARRGRPSSRCFPTPAGCGR